MFYYYGKVRLEGTRRNVLMKERFLGQQKCVLTQQSKQISQRLLGFLLKLKYSFTHFLLHTFKN
jgi:hypothetical protein